MLDAAERVGRVQRRLTQLVDSSSLDAEIVLVDDGSGDGTWEEVRSIADADDRVVGLRLDRNYGQTGALCAGFSVAQGQVVVMMDDDLESDVTEVLRFVDAVREGAEFASGWRIGQRNRLRSLGSSVYNARMRRRGLPFHDAGCGFDAMTLELARALAADGWSVRQHRFKPRVAQLTDRIVEVPFPVRPTNGSHQTVRRLAASWLDVELAFGGMSATRFATLAIGVPGTLSAALLRRAVIDRHHRARNLIGAGATGLAALFAADALRTRNALERRSRQEPPFRVAERVGRGLSSRDGASAGR